MERASCLSASLVLVVVLDSSLNPLNPLIPLAKDVVLAEESSEPLLRDLAALRAIWASRASATAPGGRVEAAGGFMGWRRRMRAN